MGGEVGFVFNVFIMEGIFGFCVVFNYLDDLGFIDYDYLVCEFGILLLDLDFID